jgi:hypothetical protein
LLRLYGLHLGGILAVWLGMYYPGADVVLALLYLLVIFYEGRYAANHIKSPYYQAVIALLWQAPGFVLAGSVLLGLDRFTDFAYYFIFILELWVTPILPLVSLLPLFKIAGYPLYYYFLFMLVPIMGLIYLWPAFRQKIDPLA